MRTTMKTTALLALVPLASAKLNTYHIQGLLATDEDASLPTQYVELPIDHFNSNAGTFKNRWWFNDTHYQPGGPVIVQDVGEENAAPFVNFLQDPSGVQTSVMALAEKYNGIGIVWEHRYYGESVPFVQNNQASSVAGLNANQWSYLTFEQALEDVVRFANNFTLPSTASAAGRVKSADALHASKTPWIFLGGSYPGVRAATLRTRNPETIFASWASSAPVQAQINMASYGDAVERGLPQNCSTDLATAIKFYDDTVKGSDASLKSQVKNSIASAASGQQVPVSMSDQASDAQVGEALKLVFNQFQSGGPASVQPFCDVLETVGGQSVPSSSGLSSQLSSDQVFTATVRALAAISAQASTANTNGGLGQPIWASVSAAPDDSSTNSPPPDSISWNYQFCSEFGFYQITDTNSQQNIITTLDDINQAQSECNSMFPNMLPSQPQVNNVLKYGGWTQNPTRVMFTNGELDPWKTLSVASTENGAPKRSPTTTVPAFDGQPDGSQYYGAVYSGQVHAVDFFSAPNQPSDRNEAAKTGLGLFTAALDQWLPNFKPGNDPVFTTPSGTATGTAATASSTNNHKNGAAVVGPVQGSLAAGAAILAAILMW